MLAELALGPGSEDGGDAAVGDQCEGCTCANGDLLRVAHFLPALHLDTTTTVLMTVASVGTLCAAVFACYLACKTCGEVVEGSQVKTT